MEIYFSQRAAGSPLASTRASLELKYCPLKPLKLSQHYDVEGFKGSTSIMLRETCLLDSGCTFFQSVFFVAVNFVLRTNR